MLNLIPYSNRSRNAVYNPFRIFDQMEKDFFNSNALDEFKVDVREYDDRYEMEADLPGFNKKDIRVDLDNDCLTIQAERKSEHKKGKGRKNKCMYSERTYGSFSRSFGIDGIDKDGIRVKYHNGVLRLLLPKLTPDFNGTRRLKIE